MLENCAVCVNVDMRNIDCKMKIKLVLNCCNVHEPEARERKIAMWQSANSIRP